MKPDPPFLSIVTVTFNAESTLEGTLRSVAAQQGLPAGCVEHVILDGASTDGTVRLAEIYKESQGRPGSTGSHLGVTVRSEPDRGLYDAMNKGLAMACGEYVWFLNAGDEIAAPDVAARLLEQVDRARERDAEGRAPDIVYGETVIIDPAGAVVGPRRLKAPKQLSWREFKRGMLVSHQSFLVRRDLAPGFNTAFRFSADFDWAIRCMKASEARRGGSHGIHNTRLVLSRYLEEGLTTANRVPSLRERYRIMTRYYGKFPVLLLHVAFAVRFFAAKVFRKSVA